MKPLSYMFLMISLSLSVKAHFRFGEHHNDTLQSSEREGESFGTQTKEKYFDKRKFYERHISRKLLQSTDTDPANRQNADLTPLDAFAPSAYDLTQPNSPAVSKTLNQTAATDNLPAASTSTSSSSRPSWVRHHTKYPITSSAPSSSSSSSLPRTHNWPPSRSPMGEYDKAASLAYASLGLTRAWVGDLAEVGAMAKMLEHRSFQGEIIAFYHCCRFLNMAINAVLQVEAAGFQHHILIMNSQQECEQTIQASHGLLDSCAWQSKPVQDDPTDPFFKLSTTAGRVVRGQVELGTRHYFIWRFLQAGVNTLWLDTDAYLPGNPYPYFKTKLKDVNLIMKDHLANRAEVNTGVMYAQNVRPDGPVADIFKDTFLRWKWAHQNKPITNKDGLDITSNAIFEQYLMSDALLSHIQPCQDIRRLQMSEPDSKLAFYIPLALKKMRKVMAATSKIEVGCGPGGSERFKVSGPLEFGWKEDVYRANQLALQAVLEDGEAAARGVLTRHTPLVVHVRDQGGHAWEKMWRLAQLGRWDMRVRDVREFGQAVQRVVGEGKGRVLHLTGLSGEDRRPTLQTPVDYLNAVEMFEKVAVLSGRVAVLPSIPCSLTLLANSSWPHSCPNQADSFLPHIRWHVSSLPDSSAPLQPASFHCHLTEGACRSTCRRQRWHVGDIEGFLTTLNGFQDRFTTKPIRLKLIPASGSAKAGGRPSTRPSITAAQLHLAFKRVAREDNVEIHVDELPELITGLSRDDHRRLLACKSSLAASQLLSCDVESPTSKDCEKLNLTATQMNHSDSSIASGMSSATNAIEFVYYRLDANAKPTNQLKSKNRPTKNLPRQNGGLSVRQRAVRGNMKLASKWEQLKNSRMV